MKIYVASSWRNLRYRSVVKALVTAEHDVFDFRNPYGQPAVEFEKDFSGNCSYEDFLTSGQAVDAFRRDYEAMRGADACVLVLPSGRSSHLEAGWFIGGGRPCYILAERDAVEHPELMYAMAKMVTPHLENLIEALEKESRTQLCPAADDD